MDRDLQAALDAIAGQFRGTVLPLRRYTMRTVSGAEAAPTDLGRGPFPRRAAAHRAARAGLASGRRDRGLAVAAARDARASRYAEASDRGGGARFLGAEDLLQGAALRYQHPVAGRVAPPVLGREGADRRRHQEFRGDRRARADLRLPRPVDRREHRTAELVRGRDYPARRRLRLGLPLE